MKGGTVQINWHDTKPVLTVDFHPHSGLLATGGADFDIKVNLVFLAFLPLFLIECPLFLISYSQYQLLLNFLVLRLYLCMINLSIRVMNCSIIVS